MRIGISLDDYEEVKDRESLILEKLSGQQAILQD